jgi:hypothetical protein
MVRGEPNKRFLFEFDEKGTKEVSEQIMDSYNIGFIDQGTAIADREDFMATEG